MPIHDWTRVDAGLFHAFHQDWIGVLARALNAGVLPRDYFALREQSIRDPVPDVPDFEVIRETRRLERSICRAGGSDHAAPCPSCTSRRRRRKIGSPSETRMAR